MSPEDPKLALQVRVGKMLGYGFAFSVVVIGGVGTAVLPLTVWLVIKALSK